MAVIERRKTASAKYDPTSARAIREAAEEMELEVAVRTGMMGARTSMRIMTVSARARMRILLVAVDSAVN